MPAPMPRTNPGGNPAGNPAANPFSNPGMGGGGGNANANGVMDAAQIAAQGSAGLSPEEQAVLIEAERARLQSVEDAVGSGPIPRGTDYFPPAMLPPTKFSAPEPPEGPGGGLNP
jgi:hypothetical protein